MRLTDLETPAPVVDLDRLAHNLDRAAAYATEHNLALRPHIKTHKSQYITREQLKRGAAGVTCATAYEAQVMSRVCDNLLLAYPPVGPRRVERLSEMSDGAQLTISLDSKHAVDAAAAVAERAKRSVGVYVELDLGMHRVGIPKLEDALALGKAVRNQKTLTFRGIAFYPGHIREDVQDQDRALGELSSCVRQAIDAFERAGLHPDVVSGGSTPTVWRSHEVDGVTEIRPGTYVFNDRTTALIGACRWEECALTVLATVVSTAVPGQAVVDAGSKALGREPVRGSDGAGGFGCVMGREDIIVKGKSEEHGILD